MCNYNYGIKTHEFFDAVNHIFANFLIGSYLPAKYSSKEFWKLVCQTVLATMPSGRWGREMKTVKIVSFLSRVELA